MLVVLAGALIHFQLESLEKLIHSHSFENSIEERMAGVDTTFQPGRNVISFTAFDDVWLLHQPPLHQPLLEPPEL